MASDTVPAWLRDHLQRIDAEIEELSRKREVVVDLIDDWKRRQAGTSSPPPAGTAGVAVDEVREMVRGLVPAEAVDVAVARAPGQFTRKNLVDVIERVVESDASNRRAVIFNALRRKEGKDIVKDEHGRLYPANGGPPGTE